MNDECEQFQQDAFDSEHQTTAVETFANQGQLPSKSVPMSDDLALIHKTRKRLAAPQRVKVLIDDP